jgi:sedoheptulose-bisphosphatase
MLYFQLINYYVKEKYTLRYTGGMVPDVNQVHTYISTML